MLPLSNPRGAQTIQSAGQLDIPELGEVTRDLRGQAVQAFFFHNLQAVVNRFFDRYRSVTRFSQILYGLGDRLGGLRRFRLMVLFDFDAAGRPEAVWRWPGNGRTSTLSDLNKLTI